MYNAGYAVQQNQNTRQIGRHVAGPQINDIVGALNELKLALHGIDSKNLPVRQQDALLVNQEDGLERGVVNDRPSAVELPSPLDEKTPLKSQQTTIDVLPSYEECAQPMAEHIRGQNAAPTAFAPDINNRFLPTSNSAPVHQALVTDQGGFEQFRLALLQYSQGTRGAKRNVKMAARGYMSALFEQQMARRQQQNGRRCCGQRRQVKQDLRPIKDLLKTAIKDVRHERKMQY